MTSQIAARALMRRQQAASYIGVSTPTLDRWRTTGEGPAYLKVGATIVYDRVDCDAFLDKCRRTSTSDQYAA